MPFIWRKFEKDAAHTPSKKYKSLIKIYIRMKL